jgi:hypothetical protein
MAKWACPCGNQIRSSGAIPNPQEWHLTSDATADELFDDSPGGPSFEQFLDRSVLAYRCEQCGRLHVYWSGIGEWPPTIYLPESG